MIKFNGTSFLNNIIISSGEPVVPLPPAVTTQWPASQPLLFDQTQPESDLWGVLNFEAPVDLLGDGCESSISFMINLNSSPNQNMPLSKAFNWIGGESFTYTPTIYDEPNFYDRETSVDSTFMGGDGAYNDADGTWQYAYFQGLTTNPTGTPDVVTGQSKKLGDITDVSLTLKNDKPSKVAAYFTPDPAMPQSKTFIDNWGPLGYYTCTIKTSDVAGPFAQMDGSQPVNALAGIVKRSAVNTLPSAIAFSDIVCGVLIRNNDAIFIQAGVELYRTNTTTNPGTIAPNQPAGGGYVEVDTYSAFWGNVDTFYPLGYDGFVQGVNDNAAPNGLSDYTFTLRLNDTSAFIPKKNGTHAYPITLGGQNTTTTITYNATTNFVSTSTTPSGTTFPGTNIEYSELALVLHNETDLVNMATDINGRKPVLEMQMYLGREYDRESMQCRSF